MIQADKQTFAQIVMGFAELKGKQLSKPALELFWNSMQHWPIEDFQAAANQLIRTCEFMPTPKHFEDLRKAGRATVGEAWLKAKDAAGSCYVGGAIGYGSGGSCGDPLIDRVVRAVGGYRAIAMCDSDKLGWLEKRFAEHFESMQDAEDTRDAVPQIARAYRPHLSGPRHILDYHPDDPA